MVIKIFDEQAAIELENRGFSYMTEKINKGQKVYSFAATEELLAVLAKDYTSKDFIEDYTLRF